MNTSLRPHYRSMTDEQVFWRDESCFPPRSQTTTSLPSPTPFPVFPFNYHSPNPCPRHLPAFSSDHRIKQQEFSQFATMFRQQRIRMRYSAKKVALYVRCSRSTILSFEDLRLSLRSMRKWKQHLQNWLRVVAQQTQVMMMPLVARQQALEPTKDPETLKKDKKTPWRPWSPEVAEEDMTKNFNKDTGCFKQPSC